MILSLHKNSHVSKTGAKTSKFLGIINLLRLVIPKSSLEDEIYMILIDFEGRQVLIPS